MLRGIDKTWVLGYDFLIATIKNYVSQLNLLKKGEYLMIIRNFILGVCFLVLTGICSTVYAAESDFSPKQGYYIGASAVYNYINKDFNDTMYYTDGALNYNVPAIDSALGFGVTIGKRNEIMAVEITYQRVEHDTHTIYPGMGDQNAYYNVVDLNLKFEVFARDRLRPNFLIGIGAPWLDIEKNRTDGTNFTDETFIGYSLNIGGGLSYYLTSRWFINTAAMYRWQRFKEVDNGSLSQDAMGNGMNCMVGLAYTF